MVKLPEGFPEPDDTRRLASAWIGSMHRSDGRNAIFASASTCTLGTAAKRTAYK